METRDEITAAGRGMMFLLSWTIGYGKDCHGGNMKAPSWPDISEALLMVSDHGGTLTLNIIGGLESSPQTLQVIADGGCYMLTLGEAGVEDYNIRTYTNGSASSEQVEILGDYWDAREVCLDFDVVVAVFREFFDTGDVSRKLLS